VRRRQIGQRDVIPEMGGDELEPRAAAAAARARLWCRVGLLRYPLPGGDEQSTPWPGLRDKAATGTARTQLTPPDLAEMPDDRIIEIGSRSGWRARPRRRRRFAKPGRKGVVHREGKNRSWRDPPLPRPGIIGVDQHHPAATDRARPNAVALGGRPSIWSGAPSWIATVALEKAIAPSLSGCKIQRASTTSSC